MRTELTGRRWPVPPSRAGSARRPSVVLTTSLIGNRLTDNLRRQSPSTRQPSAPTTQAATAPTSISACARLRWPSKPSKPRVGPSIGCIYRGKQLIVAGDQKQLPPTSFFDRTADTDEEDIDEQVLDFESVLDRCKAQGFVPLPLNWHYRSRHEALITYSNHSFYNGRLHTFPGAVFDSADLGVELFNVDGIYRRGTTRDNPAEAAAVVDRVLFHRQHHAEATLGVVALSTAQQAAVEAEIERRSESEPELRHLTTALDDGLRSSLRFLVVTSAPTAALSTICVVISTSPREGSPPWLLIFKAPSETPRAPSRRRSFAPSGLWARRRSRRSASPAIESTSGSGFPRRKMHPAAQLGRFHRTRFNSPSSGCWATPAPQAQRICAKPGRVSTGGHA